MTLTTSTFKVLQKGGIAPDFNLPGIDGKNYSLKHFKDKKALLVVFMCNHCPYVIPKIPVLIGLQRQYANRGLQILGINANDTKKFPEDSFDQMKVFAKDQRINFAYLFDEAQLVPKKYGAVCTPDPFLFNSKLELQYHGRIDDAHGKPHEEAKTNELEEAIIQVIATGKNNVPALPSMGCNIKWK
ncbi:MAG: thioredoxin family protein [archaeon]|nr:thioredoxin family protein [archaeon]